MHDLWSKSERSVGLGHRLPLWWSVDSTQTKLKSECALFVPIEKLMLKFIWKHKETRKPTTVRNKTQGQQRLDLVPRQKTAVPGCKTLWEARSKAVMHQVTQPSCVCGGEPHTTTSLTPSFQPQQFSGDCNFDGNRQLYAKEQQENQEGHLRPPEWREFKLQCEYLF